MSEEFSGMTYADIMDDIFARSKSFSGKEYYDEMVRICPELKKKWWERIPSEEQVKKMVADWYSLAAIDGKESIPEAEKKLGIAIGGGYKFPNGKSDVEYHREQAIKHGGVDIFQQGDGRDFCFEKLTDIDGKEHVSKKPAKERAYVQAWRNLQHGSREQMVSEYQKEWAELCELNPELKNIKFDKNNLASLGMAQAGVMYDFPAKDIELFLQEHEKGVDRISRTHEARIQRELAEAGIKDFTPHWVPSSETIKMMGERLREKEAREKGFVQQNAALEQKVAPVKEMAAESMDKLEQKLAAKGGTKTAALTAEQIAEQAVKQAGILAQAAAANAKFDRAVDAAIDGGAEILNETLLGRAYDKAEKAVSNTKVAKAVGKTAEKAGQAVAKTAVGKAVTKTVAKTAGTAVGKSVLKKIPLVSLGAGAYFAWQRLKDGDWKGACGEVASGALGCLPGLGTAASTAIDVGLAARDISGVVNENGEAAIEQKGELTAAARPAKVSAEMKAEIAARGEVKKSEFKAAARPLTAEKATLFKKSREY